MADATALTPPSPELSATLLPNKSVKSYSPKGPENLKSSLSLKEPVKVSNSSFKHFDESNRHNKYY